MGFKVEWDNSRKTVIRVDVQGYWTWEEYAAGIEETYDLMVTVEHTVDVIIHGIGGLQVPSGNMLAHVKESASLKPDNMGILLLVGANPFIRAIGNIFARISKRSTLLLYANSLEEGRLILAERREQVR